VSILTADADAEDEGKSLYNAAAAGSPAGAAMVRTEWKREERVYMEDGFSDAAFLLSIEVSST
jgi:hypothetical protein